VVTRPFVDRRARLRFLEAELPDFLMELVRRHDHGPMSEDDREVIRDLARTVTDAQLVGVPPATVRRIRAFQASAPQI